MTTLAPIMTDSQNHRGGGDADRASRVQRVVEDCLARRAAGARLDDDDRIARHRGLDWRAFNAA
jgi:hypothetical protein